jgi:Tfp pilus assembly protein PilF
MQIGEFFHLNYYNGTICEIPSLLVDAFLIVLNGNEGICLGLGTEGPLAERFEHRKMKKVKNSVLCFMIVLCSCSTLHTADNQRAKAHFQLGMSYMNDNNIQPAFVEFQKAMELDPENKEVLNMLGIIYLAKLENYTEAIKYFKKAMDVDSDYSEAANNLGMAYERAGQLDESVRAYKTALSNPMYRNAEKAFSNLGGVYYRMKKYNESIDAYKESLRRYPDFHLPYYGLALCYNSLNQYGDSAAALTRAIELDPNYKGDRDKAEEDFRNRKMFAMGDEEKDFLDWLEILNY